MMAGTLQYYKYLVSSEIFREVLVGGDNTFSVKWFWALCSRERE